MIKSQIQHEKEKNKEIILEPLNIESDGNDKLVTILNLDALNLSIERKRVVEWVKKKKKTQLYAAYKPLTSAFRAHTD